MTAVPQTRVAVVGGGAAGFFGAIACAEAASHSEVTIFEKGPEFLQKVRISGGGRCNVTHACFDPRELTRHYPRGERELIGPCHLFQARHTVAWFDERGVALKTEPDGRMFPTTDSSRTIIDCLLHQAREAQVRMNSNCGATAIRHQNGHFTLELSTGTTLDCDRVLLATGGCRSASLGRLATGLGHTLQPPVPSLFTFHIEVPWVRELAGVSLSKVEVSVPEMKLRESGPLLFTHWGLSGPAILRLSAWGARLLHDANYQFTLRVNWLPEITEERLCAEFDRQAQIHGQKFVARTPLFGLPARVWEKLAETTNVRWAAFGKSSRHQLARRLFCTELPVTGKSLNKDEFVTCGGVRLNEVNFKTMESRICPGLYFAGELLDIDGITGGFNFQAAWTTGWIAGRAIAASLTGRNGAAQSK